MSARAVTLLLAIATSLLSADALAQSAGRVAEAAAVLLAAGVAEIAIDAAVQKRLPPNEQEGTDLADWVIPNSGSSRESVTGCGIVLDARLTGTPTRNYLKVTTFNESNDTLLLLLNEVRLGEDSPTRYRRVHPGSQDEFEPVIFSHQRLRRSYALSKPLFKHLGSITAYFTVAQSNAEPCRLRVAFTRPPGVPERESSSTVFSSLELALAGGLHFGASGDVRSHSGAVKGSFELDLRFFPWLHHGFALDSGFDVLSRHGRGEAGFFLLPGYTFRIFPTRRVTLSYGFNPGPYWWQPDPSVPTQTTEHALGLRQKLRLDFLFAKSGDERGEVGPTFAYSLFPGGGLGGPSGQFFTTGLEVVLGE
jgi:hypothetical protein